MSIHYKVKCDEPGCGASYGPDDTATGWVKIDYDEHRCPAHATLLARVMHRINAGDDTETMAQDIITLITSDTPDPDCGTPDPPSHGTTTYVVVPTVKSRYG